jgi:hypothetical protein
MKLPPGRQLWCNCKLENLVEQPHGICGEQSTKTQKKNLAEQPHGICGEQSTKTKKKYLAEQGLICKRSSNHARALYGITKFGGISVKLGQSYK